MHDKIKAIAEKYQATKDQLLTEEATKNALIMPFIAALGYDVFNPLEVVPEFGAGIGGKKADKIDYAIKKGEGIAMLIECKCCSYQLSDKCIMQLFHYFTACDAHLAVLTNGVEYHFFADTDKTNKMDAVPFFTFNILNFDTQQLNELARFTKQEFNIDSILSTANEMKDRAAVKRKLEEYFLNPSDNFVKCLLSDLNYPGMKTQQVISTFSAIIKDAFNQFVKERVSDRLKKALQDNQGDISNLLNEPESPQPAAIVEEAADSGIVTTPEEIEAYAAIKAIAREIIPINRVFMRDAKSYCAILLDNKNYKPIVRLYFNNPANMRLNIFAGPLDKKGEMVPITALDDIYQHADLILAGIKAYEVAPDYNPHKEGLPQTSSREMTETEEVTNNE